MKQTLAISVLGLVGLTTVRISAQLELHPQETTQTKEEHQTNAPRRAQALHSTYQHRETWYEFLLRQFNSTDFDYGAWMEARRQVFLNESVRNPYFNYSAGFTLALMLMAMFSAKQWIDQRRTLWITAEMMADLYNHDLHSRGVAENAIRTYNEHIERCNRAIEAEQNGALPAGDSDRDQLNARLQKTASELNQVTKESESLEEKLRQKSEVIVALSLRVDALAKKNGGLAAGGQPIDLSSADPKVTQLINDLQEQLHVERNKNKRLKGA